MQRWKKKQFWIRPIFQRRQEHGASNNLVQEPRYENQENKMNEETWALTSLITSLRSSCILQSKNFANRW